jgi:hypothetical protein
MLQDIKSPFGVTLSCDFKEVKEKSNFPNNSFDNVSLKSKNRVDDLK